MESTDNFVNQIDLLLKREHENKERLVIHGTYRFTNAYSILKNGFYFSCLEVYDNYDEDEDIKDVNTIFLSDTSMSIPTKDALNYVINYSYNVNDKERGSRYSVILRVPSERIQSVENVPDFCPKQNECNAYLDKKYVVAVIDKVKRRVITTPTAELDEEFNDEMIEEKSERSVSKFIYTQTISELEEIIKATKELGGTDELVAELERRLEHQKMLESDHLEDEEARNLRH